MRLKSGGSAGGFNGPPNDPADGKGTGSAGSAKFPFALPAKMRLSGW